MKKSGTKRKPEIAGPTEEQMAGAVFEIEDVTDKRRGGGTITIGKAYRRRPMIDILYEANVLSEAQFKALRHYRHHADLADRSPTRDSLCQQRGGSGAGMTVGTLIAVRLVADVESAAGTLVDILRAVVVYDTSLSQWAMDREGSIEECWQRKGKRVCVLKPRRNALDAAKLEIRVVASRVEAELAA